MLLGYLCKTYRGSTDEPICRLISKVCTDLIEGVYLHQHISSLIEVLC